MCKNLTESIQSPLTFCNPPQSMFTSSRLLISPNHQSRATPHSKVRGLILIPLTKPRSNPELGFSKIGFLHSDAQAFIIHLAHAYCFHSIKIMVLNTMMRFLVNSTNPIQWMCLQIGIGLPITPQIQDRA